MGSPYKDHNNNINSQGIDSQCIQVILVNYKVRRSGTLRVLRALRVLYS